MTRALAPGRVYAVGDTVASGNAKVEVRTGVSTHARRGHEARHAFFLAREPGDAGERGEMLVALDAGELACLRDACNQALARVRR